VEAIPLSMRETAEQHHFFDAERENDLGKLWQQREYPCALGKRDLLQVFASVRDLAMTMQQAAKKLQQGAFAAAVFSKDGNFFSRLDGE